jgi:hypothetical protein
MQDGDMIHHDDKFNVVQTIGSPSYKVKLKSDSIARSSTFGFGNQSTSTWHLIHNQTMFEF